MELFLEVHEDEDEEIENLEMKARASKVSRLREKHDVFCTLHVFHQTSKYRCIVTLYMGIFTFIMFVLPAIQSVWAFLLINYSVYCILCYRGLNH